MERVGVNEGIEYAILTDQMISQKHGLECQQKNTNNTKDLKKKV